MIHTRCWQHFCSCQLWVTVPTYRTAGLSASRYYFTSVSPLSCSSPNSWYQLLSPYIWRLLWAGVLCGALLQFVGSPLILEFLGGCLIAILPRSRTMAWLSAIFAIAWGTMIIATRYESVAYQPALAGDDLWLRVFMWGVPAFLLIYSAVQLRLTGRIWNAFSYLGDTSYFAYLAQDFILILLVMLRGITPPNVTASLAIIFCWWIAVRVHEGLEKPLLKLFRPRRVAPVREFLGA